MSRLEINTSDEWLIVFSPVDFDDIDKDSQGFAASWFTSKLLDKLVSAGYSTKTARGSRQTCHGWNGATNFFRTFLGPVGSISALTDNEKLEIFEIIDGTEKEMKTEWQDLYGGDDHFDYDEGGY